MSFESAPTIEKFVTLDQLVESQLIPLPKDTLYRWAEKGVITGYKAGKRWLFRISEVIQDIEGFKNHGSHPIPQRPEKVGSRLARGWR